jgi:hypothetical protein
LNNEQDRWRGRIRDVIQGTPGGYLLAEQGPVVPTVTVASTESTDKENAYIVLWKRRCGLLGDIMALEMHFM